MTTEDRIDYEEFFRLHPMPAVVIDAESLAIMQVNDAAARDYGYSVAEFEELSLLDLLPPEDLPSLQERRDAHRTLPVTASRSTTLRHLRKDGTIREIDATCVRIRYRGRDAELAYFNDVTARRSLDEHLRKVQKSLTNETLVAGLAHEIANPLTYVRANLALVDEILAGKGRVAAPGDVEQLVKEAREGIEQMCGVMSALRGLSWTDADVAAPVDVREVLESCLRICRAEIRDHARVARRYEDVPLVHASASRLKQVFLNLIINALHAMPEGHSTENELRIEAYTDSSGRAVVEVSDNGEGIPADLAGRIFDPFFTTKPPGVGTGLGLSVSRSIVEALGGKIAIATDVERRTTLRVALPPRAAGPRKNSAGT